MSTTNGVCVSASFPFGRYAATPWFRSRREHVGNVEWPPSPWRLARALVASAHALGGDDLAEEAAGLARRLAASEPRYRLPPAGEVVYAQWMPQLNFDDSPAASQRSENGHTLLAVSPQRELLVRWPGVTLDADERELLALLLENVRYLGQSVSLCELCLRDVPPERATDETEAVPLSAEDELAIDGSVDRTVLRLLAPEPEVTLGQLHVSTRDGLVKAMPAPPGSRWVEYLRVTPRPSAPRPRPQVRAVVYRLEGPLRPPVPTPLRPDVGHRSSGGREDPTLAQLFRRASGYTSGIVELAPIDDDGDARAERLVVRLGETRSISDLGNLLRPSRRLQGPAIDCALRLDRVDWTRGHEAAQETVAESPLTILSLSSRRRPLLVDALAVAEVFRRRLLGVAKRRFGGDAIPSRLSGRQPDRRPLDDGHNHAHFLLSSGNGVDIDTVAVWCPSGFSALENGAIAATTLPALSGAPIRLSPSGSDPLTGPARRWRSHTPFLPVGHVKRRGGAVVNTPADQVAEELVRRGCPPPRRVEPLDGAWGAFRILRHAKAGCFPALGAHGFLLEFDEDVAGPIAVGRNSHFGMGLFLPVD